MSGLAGLSNTIWGITVAAECLLIGILILRGSFREYPMFLSYISVSLLQSLLLFLTYKVWGYSTYPAWASAWGSQIIVLTFRALAVGEICYRLFQSYRGIWELIRRVLLVSAAIVLLYAAIVARHNWFAIMPNLQRSLDLAMATGLVGLFLFARYYQVQPTPALGALALGFLLFSSFGVLNATVLEGSRLSYGALWTLLQMVAFLASVLIWSRALWQPSVVAKGIPMLPSSDLYQVLAPEVNLKLRHLNGQLSRFWKVEAKQP